MTEQELINELKKMYETADDKKQVASIHLFGIKYADELKNKSLKNIIFTLLFSSVKLFFKCRANSKLYQN